MDASLGLQTENLRLFLFSGISPKLEKSLLQKIESLHGKVVYPVKDTFTRTCTHVIAQEFSTTEKVLGALAGGKWLLSINYIVDSHEKGHWLKEEGYELTDLNGVAVAKFHRRERMLKGHGLYEGWKVLVMLDPPLFSRKFKRILVAGGAEIALKDDISGIDFVLTKKEMLDQVKAKIDTIPLVDLSYIKNTLLFRHPATDLKKCDLRDPQELKPSSKSIDGSSEKAFSSCVGKESSQRSASGISPYKKKKFSSLLKQSSLSQFMSPSAETPSSSNSACGRAWRVPEKNNLDKCASKSSHSENPAVVDIADDDDDNQNQDGLENGHTNQIQQAERKCLENVTLNTLERSQMGDDDIQNQDGLKRNDIDMQLLKKNISENVAPVSALLMTGKVKGVIPKQDGMKSNYSSEIQQTKKIYEAVTPFSSSSEVSSVGISNQKVKLKEFHICLRKKVDFLIDPKLSAQYLPKCKALHSKQLENMAEPFKLQPAKYEAAPAEPTGNESVIPKPLRLSKKGSGEHNLVSEQVHHNKAVSPKSSVYTVKKMDIWKAILEFVRTRSHLNGVCCTTTLSIPKGNENFSSVDNCSFEKFDSHQVLDAPNCQPASYKHRELTTRELHFYICCTDDEAVNDKTFLVSGIDILLQQVSSYFYPPPGILGRLLKKFIGETRFKMVHSRAQTVAYKVLSLHPPVNAKMRAYYLSVLHHAMKPDDFGTYIAWKFVRSTVERASCMESDEESLSDQSMEEEDFDEPTRALNLLQFIVLLLTEDVRDSTYGEAVQDLLTWQIFLGSSRNFRALTPPVKELLHFWISQQTTAPAFKWHLSQLVSVVLEVLWKFSGQPLFPVDELPTSLGAVQKEIAIRLKGLSSQEYLKMIRTLPTPWARAVVTFMIIQEIAHCPNRISLSYIDVRNTDFDLNAKELFLTLASYYLEVSSHRYVTMIIKKCICRIMKKGETVGSFSSTGTEKSCQTSNKEKNRATKTPMSPYLSLFENEGLQDVSKLEESAIAKMYSCIKQDNDVCRKWSKHSVSIITRMDAESFFKTLCL